MFTVGAVTATLRLQMKEWNTGVRKALRDAADLKSNFKDVGISARAMSIGLGAAALTAATAIGGLVVAAANVEEAENLFVVSMGNMADSTRKWSEELGIAIQRNGQSIRDGVGMFNLMVGSMGFTEDASVTLSKHLTKLAFDMSSLYNMGHEEALAKLRSGLVGEVEPMERLGIVVKEAQVEMFAWTHGIAENGKKLNEHQKILARVGIITEGTAKAQGDLIRTSGSATNQFRAMMEQTKALSQALGMTLLSSTTAWIAKLNSGLQYVRAWVHENEEAAASLMKGAVATTAAAGAITGLIIAVGALCTAFRILRAAALTAWAAALLPITGVTIAIGALGVVVYAIRSNFIQTFGDMGKVADLFSDEQKAMWENIKTWAVNAASAASTAWSKAYNFIGGILNGIGQGVGLISEVPSILGTGNTAGLEERAGGLLKVFEPDYWAQAKEYVAGFFKRVSQGAAESNKAIGGTLQETVQNMLRQGPEDGKAIIEKLLPDMERLKEVTGDSYDKLAEYDKLNFDELMKGAKGVIDGVGDSGKAAKKAADEAAQALEELHDTATNMRLEVFPAEAMNKALTDIQTLATKFPEIMDSSVVREQFKEIWTDFKDRGINTAEELNTALAGVSGELRTVFLSVQESVNKELRREKFYDLLDQIDPIRNALSEATSQVRILKEAGKLDEENTSLLGTALWEKLRNIGVQALDEILKKLGEVEGAGDVVDSILDARNQAMFAESVDRGQELNAELNPQVGFTQQITQDLNDLSAAGALTDETAGLLAADYWEQLKDVGTDALGEIIADTQKLSPTFAHNIKQMAEDAKRAKLAEQFNKTADAIDAIGNTVGNLGPEFKRAGQIAKAAAAVMRLAAAVASGGWSEVLQAVLACVEALGVFGNKEEEELTGMAEAMDELGAAVDRWADELTDALVEFIRTGKAGFKDFVDTVLEELLKIGISKLIVEPIADFAGDMFFAKGGTVEKGHVTDGPEAFPLAGGKIGVRGEAGSEAILPLERMGDGRMGVVSKGGGGVQVNVHAYGLPADAVTVQDKGTVNGKQVVDVVVKAVQRGMAEGAFDRDFALNFGMQRRGF